MIYYENSKGEIVGRLYETGSGWAAELGRQAEKVNFGFIAIKGMRCKTHAQAEKYLYENGCVCAATN